MQYDADSRGSARPAPPHAASAGTRTDHGGADRSPRRPARNNSVFPHLPADDHRRRRHCDRSSPRAARNTAHNRNRARHYNIRIHDMRVLRKRGRSLGQRPARQRIRTQRTLFPADSDRACHSRPAVYKRQTGSRPHRAGKRGKEAGKLRRGIPVEFFRADGDRFCAEHGNRNAPESAPDLAGEPRT